ncbi:Uncharacterized protein Zm00014a_031608 [Zea mays]|uniref:Nucleotide-diphospho-sugar transferase domain-containing protein n=1 Tax=Zea mays TaxID=4577 RepID=A0A317YCQ8_MAIZE|nr:Uncharacterized protein Zm00014a_031608 [Zea mays]
MAAAWKVVRGDASGRLLPVISFFLGAALTAAFVFLGATTDVSWRFAAWGSGARPGAGDEAKSFAELAEVLKNASMEDKTVIVTFINQAYAAPGSLLDLFLESFRAGEGTAGLLDHLLIVAVDPAALETCRSVHRHCYLLRPAAGAAAADLGAAKFFMTKDYLDMMWARNRLQQTILELGFSFLFTDVDILWFRNPMRHIAVTSDVAIACDYFNGDPDSLRNRPNGGFLYVRSARRTVEFYRGWREARAGFPPGTNEQDVLARVQLPLARRLEVRMQFLDTARCGGFCQLSDDLRGLSTMHANCCTGLENKVHDLRNVLQDWRNYTAAPMEVQSRGGFGWTKPGKCIR